MSSMLELVVGCIKKDSSQRSDDEINELLPWLRKMSDKFETLKTEVVAEILKKCSYSEKVRNDVIIRQGDKGDCFYVILSGKVSIFINTEAVPDNPEETTSLAVGSDEKKNDKKELDRSKYGNFIVQLESGKAFGELALINADCVRNASIIADEPVQMLIVNRDLYNRSLKEAQLQEFTERMNFVSRSEIFGNWLARYKRQAAFSLRKEKYPFNTNLLVQGQPTNGLIFILKGQAKVVTNCPLHNSQFPSLNNVGGSDSNKSVEFSDIERISTEPEFKSSTHNTVPKRMSYLDAEQRLAQKHVEICIVTAGEILGDLEQGLELSTNCHTVTTIEPTEVYILDSKNYERLINSKRNFKTLRVLRSKAINKIKYRGSLSITKSISGVSGINFYNRLNEIIREEEEKEIKANQKRDDILLDNTIDQPDKAGNEIAISQHRGPLIDMYGPGSVFYRNRQMRKERKKVDDKKRNNQISIKSRGGRNGTSYADQPPHHGSDDDSDIDSVETIPTGGYPKVESNQNKTRKSSQNRAVYDPTQINTVDWETTSDNLRTLESRIRDWLSSVTTLNNETALVAANTGALTPKPISDKILDNCVALKRFKPKDCDKKIVPGKKIFLTPKRPRKLVRRLTNEDLSRNKIFITAGKLSSGSRKKKEDPVSLIKEEDLPNQFSSFISDTHEINNNDYRKKKSMSDVQLPVITHQYTADDYKNLKHILKKKEMEMQIFQTSLAI